MAEVQLQLFGASDETEDLLPGGWRVRTSGRARNISIQVFANGGVEVVVPKRARAPDIAAFVTEHRDWIDRTRDKLNSDPARFVAVPESIPLPLLGRELLVEFTESQRSASRERSGRLRISAPRQHAEDCWPVLKRWLLATARANLPDRVAARARMIGVEPQRLQFRLQRTRWGSCSARGTVSLNAALLLLPAVQADYVIVHELCHLRHLNHSKRFWKLVERHVPGCRELDRALDRAWADAPGWLL